jgi:hypothetical protein
MKPLNAQDGENAFEALVMLRDGMRANDDHLNDDDKPGGSTVPGAADYNALFDLVLDALQVVGIPYRDGGAR